MLNEFVRFLKAYVNGEGGDFEFEIFVSWWDLAAILAVLATLIWVLCR